ncbi:MAG: tetratricopeptide repeat protein [Xanthomonadales bacterium]|nr:tetratricopeptide repeat protein [Xanthomonadales bacterium]
MADVDRLFVACLRLADAYGQQGEPHLQLRWIERAAALPGLGSGQRFLVVNHQAQALRDRGRYDLALERFREAYALGEDLLQSTETPFARGNAERMLRQHRDATMHLLQQDRMRDRSNNRGWRLQMAIYRIGLLPPEQRRAEDLQFAADLEAERAAVWDDGTWQAVHAGLRAQLHLQHGDLDGALRIARALPLPPGHPEAETGGYDAEFWLGLSYVLLQGGDRDQAAHASSRRSSRRCAAIRIRSIRGRCWRASALPVHEARHCCPNWRRHWRSRRSRTTSATPGCVMRRVRNCATAPPPGIRRPRITPLARSCAPRSMPPRRASASAATATAWRSAAPAPGPRRLRDRPAPGHRHGRCQCLLRDCVSPGDPHHRIHAHAPAFPLAPFARRPARCIAPRRACRRVRLSGQAR